ncbi:MAG: trigger factor [Rickettsiales bacterium]
MQIKETQNKDLERKYVVNISAKDLAAAIDKKAETMAKDIKLDGFRKGKVPPTVVKKLYKDSLYKEVSETLIQEAAEKIVKDNKLKLATQPKINIKSFDPEKGAEITFDAELFPEIPELDLKKKVKLTDYKFTLDPKEIKESEDRLLNMNKELKDAKSGTKAKDGDTVLIDFTGFRDGKEFPGGSAKDYKLELGNGHFIPGFESGLVGCKEGDNKTLKLKFPENYGSKEHAGKKVEFKVDVKKVMHAELPKFDDAFAKKLHLKDAKDLKEKINESLEENYNSIKRAVMKKDLFDQLEKLAKFDLPPSMVEGEKNALVADAERNAKDKKLSDAEKKKLEKTYTKIAERRVKLGMILSDIGQKEKIQVENKDINAVVSKQAQQMPGQEQAIIDYYKNNPRALEGVKGQILEEKVVDKLIADAGKKEEKITTKKLIELSKKADELQA